MGEGGRGRKQGYLKKEDTERERKKERKKEREKESDEKVHKTRAKNDSHINGK
ncbi:MAG: hypothetical protein Q8P67_01630 [archaeon]|nr:hypothetical protein [archaeon]